MRPVRRHSAQTGSKAGPGAVGCAHYYYSPGKEPPRDAVLDRRKLGSGQRRNLTRAYGMRQRSHLDRPRGPGWVGIGLYLGNKQEAYDAEFVELLRGIQAAVNGPDRGVDYTVFKDS